MRVIISMLLLLCASGLLVAQPGRVEWGETFEIEKGSSGFSFVKKSADGVTFMERNYEVFNSTAFINEFDINNNRLSRKQIAVEIKGKQYSDALIMPAQDGYIAFKQLLEKGAEGKMHVFYAVKLDFDLKQTGMLKMHEFPREKIERGVPGSPSYHLVANNEADFGVKASEDKKHFLVCLKPDQERDDRESFVCLMLDANIEILWKKECKTGYNHSVTNPLENGYYLTAYISSPYKFMLIGKYGKLTFAHSYDAKTDVSVTETIGKAYHMYIKDENTIESFNLIKDNKFRAPHILKMNILDMNTLKPTAEKEIVFTQEQMAEMVDERFPQLEKLYNYSYNSGVLNDIRIIRKQEGGYYLVFENSFKYPTSNKPGSIMTNVEALYVLCLNITVVSINGNFEIEWIKKIPKEQHSEVGSGNSGSFVVINRGSDLYLLYIDSRENLNSENKIIPFKKNAIIAEGHFDKYGNLTRTVYSEPEMGNGLDVSSNMFAEVDNNLYFRAVSGKKNRIGKLVIN